MRTVKRWVKEWLYVPKYEKVSDRFLSRIMLSSVLGMLICGICLVELTWAWFSSSVTSAANNITAANFSVQIVFMQNGSVIEPAIENGSYKLNSGDYTVTVKADGSATTGYCKVDLKLSVNSINTYHTVQLYPAGEDGKPQSVEFTINASDGSYLIITPQWGTFANTQNEQLIGDTQTGLSSITATETNTEPQVALSAILPDETPGADITETLTNVEQTYTIQPGDTLSKIANRYGTTVAVLSAYNKIADPNTIQAGSTIKIPTKNYTIPETTSTQPSTAESTATEPSAIDKPKQTEESSPTVSTEPSSQETVPDETTAAETQSVPGTDTTEAAPDEP